MTTFEREYQTFIEGGGFEQPCLSEWFERMLRGPLVPSTVPCPIDKCRHGITIESCAICHPKT